MPNLATLLKSEITRLAKKTLKESITPLQTASTSQRRQITALKHDIATLQKQIAQLRRSAAKGESAKEPAGEEGTPLRFQARGLRSLRAKLGLSAEEFGKLAGVSGQSVYNWETEKALPRRAQVQSIAALRSIGKREARARLEAAATATAEASQPG